MRSSFAFVRRLQCLWPRHVPGLLDPNAAVLVGSSPDGDDDRAQEQDEPRGVTAPAHRARPSLQPLHPLALKFLVPEGPSASPPSREPREPVTIPLITSHGAAKRGSHQRRALSSGEGRGEERLEQECPETSAHRFARAFRSLVAAVQFTIHDLKLEELEPSERAELYELEANMMLRGNPELGQVVASIEADPVVAATMNTLKRLQAELSRQTEDRLSMRKIRSCPAIMDASPEGGSLSHRNESVGSLFRQGKERHEPVCCC